MFEFLAKLTIPFTTSKHMYTLATTGMKKNIEQSFITRREANIYMHKIADKYSLTLIKVYDDNHFKTYCYNDGIKIHINRL